MSVRIVDSCSLRYSLSSPLPHHAQHTTHTTHHHTTHTPHHTHTHTHHTHTHTHTQLSDYGLVQFMPLDIGDEDNIANILLYVDSAIQYGEDLEVHVPKVGN